MKLIGKATIGQLTKSNPGIRFNAKQLEITGIKTGDKVEIEYSKNKIVITPIKED